MADFDTTSYLKKRFCDPEDKERGVQPFYLQSIHDFYKKYGSSWNSEAVKLIEFGGGPVLYSLISASPNVSEITFTDYSASNLRAIEKWRDNDPAAHDWEPYVHYVVSKLEGHVDNTQQLVQERIREMRSKMKHVLPCDISEHSLGLPQTQQLFDIVSSNFCMDAVAQSVEEYRMFVKRLSGIVKPGGYLHGLVSLEESWWFITGPQMRSAHLYLTKEDVISAYEDVGMSIVQTALCNVPEKSQGVFNDCKRLLYIAAKKSS